MLIEEYFLSYWCLFSWLVHAWGRFIGRSVSSLLQQEALIHVISTFHSFQKGDLK